MGRGGPHASGHPSEADARARMVPRTRAIVAVLVFAIAFAAARLLVHGDFAGDGPGRFQRLLRTHLVFEHAIYLPALRLVLAAGEPLRMIPEEAMKLLSAFGAGLVGAGCFLAVRAPVVVAFFLALAAAGSGSVLFQGGATEIHAFHGGFAAILLARCVTAGSARLLPLDQLLLFLVAGSHSSGGLAAMAFHAVRVERFTPLRSKGAILDLLKGLPAAALPLVIVLVLEPQTLLGYASFIQRQQVGEAFARASLPGYLLHEGLLTAAPLSIIGIAGLVAGTRTLRPSRVLSLAILTAFAVLFGSIGIPEHGGYFLPLVPLWAVGAAALLDRLRPPRAALAAAVVIATAQIALGLRSALPVPRPSPEKLQQRAIVARLPDRSLLILYVPWGASRATQFYLWEVHDPTRDNLALLDSDPEDSLAREMRDDPKTELTRRVRGAIAAGRPVLAVDPELFRTAGATAGLELLRGLALGFMLSPAGPDLPGLVHVRPRP